MLSTIPTPDLSPQDTLSPPASTRSSHQCRPQRILACALCQQRKVKCDRTFPCSNCVKADVLCSGPSQVPKPRRKRFPEKELLDRVRYYESLLTQHGIAFDPLHPSTFSTVHQYIDLKLPKATFGDSGFQGDVITSARSAENTGSFWKAMNQGDAGKDNDDSDGDGNESSDENGDHPSYVLRKGEVKNAWDKIYVSSDHLLFCSRNPNISLTDLHPSQTHAFRLWQIYLDNVNPLIKLTHVPTFQTRFIDAASDLTKIAPPLEALIFGIYCMAIFSSKDQECKALFGSSRKDLLFRFQLGAREALIECGFLRSSDRECLTALHLYLITVKPDTDPRALLSWLGIAIRTAQRMGIHSEASNGKYAPFEAEMRRRLWWSLVLFDSRISEMAEFKTGMLLPTWDCKLPANVNDFEMRPEMKALPTTAQGICSESLFAIIRAEFGEFMRYNSCHLDFMNPIFKAVASKIMTSSGNEITTVDALQQSLEEKYLGACDPDNPLHFMTLWLTRGSLAKCRFVEHLSRFSQSSAQPTESQREAGFSHALTWLSCDSQLMMSPLVEGFRWHLYLNFPFPAYVHIIEELRRRPLGEQADQAWKTMSENCSARFLTVINEDNPLEKKHNPFFKIFAGIILAAWTVREAANRQAGTTEETPKIVTLVGRRFSAPRADVEATTGEVSASMMSSHIDDASAMPMTFSAFNPFFNLNMHGGLDMGQGLFPTVGEQHMGMTSDQYQWPTMNWNSAENREW